MAFSDSRGTKGNFVQDVDGNVLLDMCGTESLPLGHHHDVFNKMANNKEWDRYVVNAGLDAAAVSSIGFSNKASDLMRALKPGQMFDHCRLTGGRSATELAVMDAFQRREGKKLAVGFAGASHGQGLAMTQFAHPEMSLGMGWPALTHGGSDEQVLDNLRNAMSNDVAVVLVEPVNWQTGNKFSTNLLNQMASVAREHEALFLVDETNTGCGATGNGFWAAEGVDADYLTFGKRTQATGYYSNQGTGIELGGQEHNVAMLELIKQQMDKQDLVG